MDQSFLDTILRLIKDHSFLITAIASVLLAVAYMIVFRVNPWDQQRAAKHRRDRVRFHNSVGYSLIETGHYRDARTEFEESLKLADEDQTALNGKYIANLFINIGSSTADPAIGFAIQRRLSESPSITREHHLHIIDKYLGDLYMRISDLSTGAGYYRSALERKADYPDALYALGWHYYSNGEGDPAEMERLFRELVRVDPYNYRGYHGLGYALYMQALNETDAARRSALMEDAAAQSGEAKELYYNQLNVVMDFAEIARSSNPQLALDFHEYGKQMLDDPAVYDVGDNPYPLLNKLLRREGEINIATKEQKRAWVTYQMALDHLAMGRKSGDARHREEHDRLFEEAKELDKNELIHYIYADQLSVLDLLLPESHDGER